MNFRGILLHLQNYVKQNPVVSEVVTKYLFVDVHHLALQYIG